MLNQFVPVRDRCVDSRARAHCPMWSVSIDDLIQWWHSSVGKYCWCAQESMHLVWNEQRKKIWIRQNSINTTIFGLRILTSANAMLFHQRNQLGFGEIIGWSSLTLDQFVFIDFQWIALLECLCNIILSECLPSHHFGVARIDQLIGDAWEFLRSHGQSRCGLLVTQIMRNRGQKMTANVIIHAPCVVVAFTAVWKSEMTSFYCFEWAESAILTHQFHWCNRWMVATIRSTSWLIEILCDFFCLCPEFRWRLQQTNDTAAKKEWMRSIKPQIGSIFSQKLIRKLH